ncbi:MAG: lytic transglycosylase domain-containing protein [Bryobacteraceae bacterium]|jgi:soluble lytic murein transglycosylase-like protein
MAMKLAAGLLLAMNALAGEYAILASGFPLRVDRHERDGATLRLYLNGGVMELPAASVVRFEQEEELPSAQAASGQPAPAPADAASLVAEAAARWDLPPTLLHAIARVESGYDSAAVSPKGAIGIMQLMPQTARQLGADPRDPRQNVDAGARYLVELLRKYQDDDYQVRKALAAYNAGPKAVERYQGVPPYRETMDYVRRVIRQWQPQ